MRTRVFSKLGIDDPFPIMLAPLAGTSDIPFRRVCQDQGASLTYVEMISATALCHESKRTLEMLVRHTEESLLGVQLTGPDAEQTARALSILDKMSFETIDLNMGCPVRKIVKTGCGSAILKDPERVYRTVKLCREQTAKPLSMKIRIGWDHGSVNAVEVCKAGEEAGIDWITVHGRTRSDNYAVPVDLEMMARCQENVQVPLIGNGNLFSRQDVTYMKERTNVDGVMISRGALGNPWVFARAHGRDAAVGIDEWQQVVSKHLDYQERCYGASGRGAVCMRKHLLWYTKGWPHARHWRARFQEVDGLDAARRLLDQFCEALRLLEPELVREEVAAHQSERFHWDPKWEMDRRLDRGVGTDHVDVPSGL